MAIGDRIKRMREERNMTQTELADAIGTTKQNIYKYENGIVTNIPSDKIEAISKCFKISPAYLMGWMADVMEQSENTLRYFDPTKPDAPMDVEERQILKQDISEQFKDDRIVVLARHLQEIPDEDRASLIDNLESTIDMYLKAKGLK